MQNTVHESTKSDGLSRCEAHHRRPSTNQPEASALVIASPCEAIQKRAATRSWKQARQNRASHNQAQQIHLYGFIPSARNAETKELSMPPPSTESGRIELRLRLEDKATLKRAASLRRLDLTGYILGAMLPKAKAEIAESERLTLSARDSLRVLALLENPPEAPARLVRATRAGRTLR